MTTTTTPATTGPAQLAAKHIRHNHGCPGGPVFEAIGRHGDEIVQCPGCKRAAFLHAARRAESHKAQKARRKAAAANPTPAPAPATDEPPEAPTPDLPARYYCRTHGRPVTWKGTGCPECEHEHAARQRDREHAARARRERAERDRQG